MDNNDFNQMLKLQVNLLINQLVFNILIKVETSAMGLCIVIKISLNNTLQKKNNNNQRYK